MEPPHEQKIRRADLIERGVGPYAQHCMVVFLAEARQLVLDLERERFGLRASLRRRLQEVTQVGQRIRIRFEGARVHPTERRRIDNDGNRARVPQYHDSSPRKNRASADFARLARTPDRPCAGAARPPGRLYRIGTLAFTLDLQ